MKNLIIDLKNNTSKLVDFSEEEITLKQNEAEQFEIIKQNKIQEEQNKQTANQSAIDKLKALGLTDEEIEAFRGK